MNNWLIIIHVHPTKESISLKETPKKKYRWRYTYIFYVHNFCPLSKVSQLGPILNRSSVSLKTRTKATKWDFPFDEATETEFPCRSWCGTMEISPGLKTMSAYRYSLAVILMTSLYDRNNLERMKQIKQINYRMSRNALQHAALLYPKFPFGKLKPKYYFMR